MKNILVVLVLLFIAQASHAQFLVQGKIEFERKINVHKQYENDAEWFNELKKNIPQ